MPRKTEQIQTIMSFEVDPGPSAIEALDQRLSDLKDRWKTDLGRVMGPRRHVGYKVGSNQSEFLVEFASEHDAVAAKMSI